jgi:hypothetical protein
MRKIEELVPKIIFAELGEEGGSDLLKHKIHYHRKRASSDPVEEIQLAETLVEYAEMLWEDGNTSPARKHVEEAIGIYENYLQKWDDRDTRGDLEAAKELLTTMKERIAALCHTDFSQIVTNILSNEIWVDFPQKE